MLKRRSEFGAIAVACPVFPITFQRHLILEWSDSAFLMHGTARPNMAQIEQHGSCKVNE